MGTYEFRIDDSWGDGLCCSYGNGGYSVKVDGEVVASGAEYTSFESTTFIVGGSTTPAPVVPPTLAPVVPPTPAPVVPPTPAPSVPPTPSPVASPVTGPPTSCSSTSLVLVEVTSDNWPGDISWYLKNEETGEEILSGGDYTDGNTLFTDSGPICPGTYEFRIDDSWGDGLCCSYGNGGYSVKVDGEVVASGGEYTSFESTTFTVGGSTTPAPVVPPTPAPVVPPTPAPVVPPTPAPSV